MSGVFNSTKWQQHRLRHFNGVTGGWGSEPDLKAVIFSLELNVVFIVTL